jgi:uncharacterized protein (TIGR03067 family)
VIGHAHRGRTARPWRLRGISFEFAGDRMRIIDPRAGTTEYHIHLDGSTSPKSIDATPTAEPEAEPKRGIYRLKGEELTITMDMSEKGAVRPKSFESADELPSVMVWVLKRVKKP